MLIDKQVNMERENNPNKFIMNEKNIKLKREISEISPVKIRLRKDKGCC